MDIQEALEEIARAPERAAIFTDFDGTLSPIVADPPKARAVRGASRVLERLARRYSVVAVISGRPVSFLARRLHARHVRMVGLYGIEERVGRSLRILPEVRAARDRVERAATRLEGALATVEGVWVERKGLAVSVHYRNAPDPAAALETAEPIVREIAGEELLDTLTRGRKVLELAPSAVDKGAVVRGILADRGIVAALAAGDDAGDIPIFEAVGSVKTPLRIAVRSAESPPGLLEVADHTVASPDEFVDVLKTLKSATRR